jgi:hypothetical protein
MVREQSAAGMVLGRAPGDLELSDRYSTSWSAVSVASALDWLERAPNGGGTRRPQVTVKGFKAAFWDVR